MDHLNSTQLSSNQSDNSSFFTKQVLPPLYCIIFLVGLSLNVMASWIFFRVPGDSGLVVYLKNMAVADLLMLSTFPFKVAADLDFGGWHLRMITCRYTGVLFYFSMYVGILFICFISLERYVKVVHHSPSSSSPSTCRSRLSGVSSLHFMQNATFARLFAIFTWGLLLLISLPNVMLTSLPADQQTNRSCMELKTPLGKQWHKMSTIFNVSLFWVTLLVLAYCYTSISRYVYKSYRRVQRDNSDVCRKSNRSIFSILAVFFICFVPYHVCRVPYTLSQMSATHFSSGAHFLLFQIKEGAIFLSALNVCLDPIIYFLMCRTFRESLLRKLSRRQRRRSLTTAQSSTNI
ncbi:P2Y purinoceptor 14-like [Melanotaenia boesemani]|uniref:P2Y purinoceptor 14-like n=1 Tax=Melanotaenia boesemani TaxID=1250792 RepID=UPI001C03B7ED|nr:P2Y purinoceptor 14-like [Melanotaenia boesemani]XP_041851149.1 P2Y purinoceptor 14-like [Melanotaenia boesemani]